MNWSMIENVPIELCQLTFSKTISAFFGTIYTETKSKTPEELTVLKKKFVSDEISQKLFQ